jgi:hypothetical protein
MKKYDVWAEGFLCTGMEGIPANAHYHGSIEAESFKEACDKLFTSDEDLKYYSPKNLSYWGCSLFDNKEDARKAFG